VEEVMRAAVGVCAAVLAAAPLGMAKDPAAKPVYCWQGANGSWSLQHFKPLIKVGGGTVFAELTFAGGVLAEVKVRRFAADSELAFDYFFDDAGKLIGLKGSVTVRSVGPTIPGETEPPVFADWLGEAELTPDSDGRIPPHHVMYSRESDRIEKPDDADKYVGQFNDAPVYATTASVPCAAMMKEAERMNAAQE
jgi:hypothetical protein